MQFPASKFKAFQLLPRQFSMGIVLAIITLTAALVSYGILNRGGASLSITPQTVWQLLLVNLGLLIVLGLFIYQRTRNLLKGLRTGSASSKLQRRVVLTFSIVTILPTLVVSLFSTLVFNMGIQAWFNERVNTAVGESLAVAEAYLEEHRENLRVDAIAMASELGRYAHDALSNSVEFNRIVSAQASTRLLTEVLVFQRNRIIAQGRLSFSVAFESLPQDAIERAASGEVVFLPADDDKVRALVKLDTLQDTYLLIGRLVDSKVVAHMEKTQGAVNEYRELKEKLTRLQTTFSLVFISLALVLVMTAAWYGLIFASRLTTPISRLAEAAERVRGGDFSGKVEVSGDENEISDLARTFNRMIDQLDTQRSELIQANRQLDERRHFIEAVLGGVSAGIIALDANKTITLHNRSAASILSRDEQTQLQGTNIGELMPGIHELLAQASTSVDNAVHSTLTITEAKQPISLHVRVTVEKKHEQVEGYIVTFDDITPLVSAQRQAAWSDVARRVAHEIKNPLTPIALSAERLKRKYLKYVEGEEAETFSKYTDTIARHVGDIGRMVDEFVGFARLPRAVMHEVELTQMLKKIIFSEQVAHATIAYRLDMPQKEVKWVCDERQISQMLGNLMKNAAEAIETRQVADAGFKGEIALRLEEAGERLNVIIADNGPGFPESKMQEVLEPYVTTRVKGMGLGLAIVKKIVEEHQGTIQLANNPDRGARVTLSFLQQCDINVTSNDKNSGKPIA